MSEVTDSQGRGVKLSNGYSGSKEHRFIVAGYDTAGLIKLAASVGCGVVFGIAAEKGKGMFASLILECLKAC